MKRSIEFFVKISALTIAVCALCTFDSYAANAASKTVIVNNKTSQFDEVFSDLGAKTADTTSADLADKIRRQRALLDNKGKADTSGGAKSSGVTGANACDATLRKCMAEKCGSDFTKCSKDSTTIWGEKMDSCRRKTNCSGHEYTLLAPEILADRDFNERMSYYNSVISCGNNYNRCIFNECGATLEKCLSKSDGDRAVSKCESVAKECKEQDSGLAARIMSVFGDLRTVAQKQVKADEARLYELRDLMRTQCNRFGAMFDERTLDCVYTVNFFAGDNTSTPTASKKLYAGDSFTCTPNWFGIDVTTFKENAYRLTRSQTAASSAMLGAGVGVAAGLISSGAIGRALDTQKAEKAAKEECENSGFTWEKGACNEDKPNDKAGNGNGGEGGNENDECPAGQHRDDAGNCVADTPAGNVECPTGQHPDESGNCVVDTPTDEQGNETTASSLKNSPLPCHMFSEEQEECKSYDNCFWMEGPGGGCVDDPQNTSQQEQQETPPATDPATPVTLNLTFADLTNTVKLPATIECKYTNKKGKKVSKKQTAKQDGEVTLSEIPLNAECTIAAVNCSGSTTTAKTLAQMNRPNSFVPLKCEVIDKCVAEGKTWVNNKCQDKPKATDGCDKVCKGLAGKLSAKNPLQVLREANKQCKDTCTPMMKTACGNLVNKTYQSKKITSAKLKIQNVTNDIHYTCEWSTDSDSNDDTNCVTTCTNLADAMSVEHPTQTLKQPSCKDACEMVIGPKCSALGLQINATLTQLKKRITSTEIQYTCEWSTDIPNDVDMCTGLPEPACKNNCTWTGEVCVKKKNNEVTPSNSNSRNGSGAGGGAQSCNLNFSALAKNMKLNTPISMANCNMKTITDQKVLDGKNLLEKTCRHNNVVLVLRADNTVANRRVNPVFENGSFTCKQTGWFTVTYINSKFGYLDEWESETKPSKESCANTCNQISFFKSAEGQEVADGKVFPGNKQCLEACAPQVEKVCTSLKDKKYGNSSVKSTKAVYKVDTDNLFRYGCELSLRLTTQN